jgi:hypothetical protein
VAVRDQALKTGATEGGQTAGEPDVEPEARGLGVGHEVVLALHAREAFRLRWSRRHEGPF